MNIQLFYRKWKKLYSLSAATSLSLADFLHMNKHFAIIPPMCSKERESEIPMVFFRSLASWHFIPLEAAERFSRIDFNNFDYQAIFEIWSVSGGRGLCMETVLWVFTDRGNKKITREIVEKLPPGSWISSDGRSFFKK